MSGALSQGRAGWRYRVGLLWHHMRTAAVVTAILVLLHHGQLLGWLDAALIRMVGAVAHAAAMPMVDSDPVVLLVSERMYEREFAQVSPLDRQRVTALVNRVAEQRPATLVLDLDLSPAATEHGAATAGLLGALKEAALHTRVVLPLPAPVRDGALARRKFEWMVSLCAASGEGVEFALPDIQTLHGDVLNYHAHAPSLGIVSQRAIEGLCATRVKSAAPSASSVPWLEVAFADAKSGTAHWHDLEPFNGPFLRRLTSTMHMIDELPAEGLPVVPGLALAGRSVFLGGAYSAADLFNMPILPGNKRIEGIAVHAAVHASVATPARKDGKLRAVLIECGLGVLLAYLFSATLFELEKARDAWRAGGKFADWLRARTWAAGNLLLVTGLTLLAVWVGRQIYFPFNLWTDLGPVVLGMFVKFAIASRHELEAVAGSGRSMEAARRSTPARLIDGGLSLGLVVWAMYTVAQQ